MDTDEAEYAELYGVDLGQMDWLFKQEYPATAAEAFQTSGEDTLIDQIAVAKARKRDIEESGPLVIGVDPARFGDDRTSIIVHRHINWNKHRPDLKEDLAHLVQDIKRRICGIASAGLPSSSV